MEKLNWDNVEAVLFDLDGTLLDTADDLGEALNFVLRKYKLPSIAREDYRPIASNGALGLLTLGFNDKLADFDYEVLRNEFLEYYQSNIAKYTHLYEGITELLTFLRTQNIPWGIVTNKPEGLTKQLLPSFTEFNGCAVMVGGDTLSKRKPDPEPLLFACKQIDVDPKQTLYIGDHIRDIEAGNSADMRTIIAQWGYIQPTEDLNSWQADIIIKNPTKLF